MDEGGAQIFLKSTKKSLGVFLVLVGAGLSVFSFFRENPADGISIISLQYATGVALLGLKTAGGLGAAAIKTKKGGGDA